MDTTTEALGLPVAPAELEAVLLTHPAIIDSAVVGVIDAIPKSVAGKILRKELRSPNA